MAPSAPTAADRGVRQLRARMQLQWLLLCTCCAQPEQVSQQAAPAHLCHLWHVHRGICDDVLEQRPRLPLQTVQVRPSKPLHFAPFAARPGVTMLLTDSGSNRQLMQNPVPLEQIGGNGPWPHRMIHPRLFLRNSNIQVAIVRYDAATGGWDTLRINFEGFRIYA